MSFSYRERQQNISKMQTEEFDLAIVGGGISGAGIARDAASRGLKVALVEAQDFAMGTSSRSSKLIHGGVRYLEHFEFQLVFEALSERATLFKIAPHLVHPLRFLVPIYKNSRVGYYKMLAGMWLYDLLALFETPRMHESLDSQEVLEKVDSLDGRGLVGAVEYSDAYTDDDRLVLESLRDAHRMGAVVASYAEVVGVTKQKEKITSLQVEDGVSGHSFQLKAKQYVASVGPWTDIFGVKVDPTWQKKLRPTKGVHLVFSRKTIPVNEAVVMTVESRILFVIPRYEMVIVGTTDTDYSGDPVTVYTHADDVVYILNALNKYFPRLKIAPEDIQSTYSGVRPLVKDESQSTTKTSREHEVFSHGPNLSFIAGGKYTTYRKISEEVVDSILAKMPFDERMGFSPSDTKKAINPMITESLYQRAFQNVEELSRQYKVDPVLVRQLVFRHGLEAEEILERIRSHYNYYSLNEALWMGEAYFAIQNTMCFNLADFYWRRAPLFLAAKNHGMKYLSAISKVFVDHLGWDSDEVNRQQERLLQRMQHELDWKNQI